MNTVMKVLGNYNNYIQLYPHTPSDNIWDWQMGEIFGPYEIELTAANWDASKQQTVQLEGITSSDIPMCVKVLRGTQEEMMAQMEAYNLLDPMIGIESLEGAVRFTCSESVPTINITVQVDWKR